MATDPLFGWDLTFKTVEKDIKRKSDVLIAFIHWNLSKRGFRSIGVGDEGGWKTETEHVPGESDDIANSIIPEEALLWAVTTFHPYKVVGIDGIFPALLDWSLNKIKVHLVPVFHTFLSWKYIPKRWRKVKRTLSGDEEKSELLPTGWNDNENYTVRYVLDNTLFILHGLNTDGNLIINLMRSEDLAVSNIAFKIDDTVKELSGPIDKMLPSNKDLIYNIKRDLIDTITHRTTINVETQTRVDNPHNRRPPDDPLRIPPRHMPGSHHDNHDLWHGSPMAYYSAGYYLSHNRPRSFAPVGYSVSIRDMPPGGLPNVGRSDLDPFAPIGGGMLFNPFGPRRDIENPGLGVPGGLPRGAVPPGARFDPFAPPPPGGHMPARRPPPPDADHLPPPGFNDNMFM